LVAARPRCVQFCFDAAWLEDAAAPRRPNCRTVVSFLWLTWQGLFIQNDPPMENPFSATPKEVERYRRLRALGMDLSHRIVKTIPRQTLNEVGKVLGILREDTFVFDSMDMTSVLMDCCLYDWFEQGKNIVQKYAEAHPPEPGTDLGYLLEAYLQAKYGVLVGSRWYQAPEYIALMS
jgi:hypothetical protein